MKFELEVAVKWIAALLAIVAIFTVTFGYIIPNFTNQVEGHESFFCTIFKNLIKGCTIPGELKELNRQLKTCKEKKMADCPEAYKALTLIKDKQIKVVNDCRGALGIVHCKSTTSWITLIKGKEELGQLQQDFLFRICKSKEDPGESSLCAECPYRYTISQDNSKVKEKPDVGTGGPYSVKSIGVSGDYVCVYYED